MTMAWAAGLFVGEGYAGNHRPRADGARHAVVAIGMTDKMAVCRFATVCWLYAKGRAKGGDETPIVRQRLTSTGKKFYTYRVTGNVAKKVLEALLPYMLDTRALTFSREASCSASPKTYELDHGSSLRSLADDQS